MGVTSYILDLKIYNLVFAKFDPFSFPFLLAYHLVFKIIPHLVMLNIYLCAPFYPKPLHLSLCLILFENNDIIFSAKFLIAFLRL